MYPLVISFGTKDSLYEEEIKDLTLSCQTLGLEHSIECIPSLGSWEKNCCYKPKYILRKLLEYKKPLFWVDADGIIINKAIINDFLEHDFAFRFNYDENKNKKSINSATIFINYTENAIEFLKKWDEVCQGELNNKKRTYEVWDERSLYWVLNNQKSKVTYFELPVSYCRVFDKYQDKIDEKTYILQFQASRFYKNFINNGVNPPEFLKNLAPFELKKMRFKK